MNTYTKSDQYYEDAYDRATIEKMKELEKQIPKSKKGNEFEVMKHRFKYDCYGADRAYDRAEFIRSLKEADQQKDRLIANTPIPRNVLCKMCYSSMDYETLSFSEKDKLIFFFQCPNGHLPKKAVYPDGSEHYIKPKGCSYCAGPVETTKKQTKLKLTLTDICKLCGKIDIVEFEFPRKKPAIKDEDRIKYCIRFIGKGSLRQDMQLILDSEVALKEKEVKYDYSHVEQINIVQLEKKLNEELEKAQFVKFQFEKPKSGRWLTVEFSAQDFSSRDERDSVKTLKKKLTNALFNTNWRLMSTDIFYKLGFLTGQIKGFSLEEDLIKIGKEIDTKLKDRK